MKRGLPASFIWGLPPAEMMMNFGEMLSSSKRVRKGLPMKDVELAIREVLEEYAHLPKATLMAALERQQEEVEDESWLEKATEYGESPDEETEDGEKS